MAEVIRYTAETPRASVEPALEALERGGLIAGPTETVYGLFVRGDEPESVERLKKLKGRDGNKPLALYVAGADGAAGHVSPLSPSARRLVDAFWPGPLTLVVPRGSESVGLRCSAHPWLMRLAAEAPFPILGTSANLSGRDPIAGADEIARVFGDSLEVVVADDDAVVGAPSTVLRLDESGRHEVLRQGEIAESTIAEEMAPRILFVCTGNTCRSPMAESIYRDRDTRLARSGRPRSRVFSAGISAQDGAPASPEIRDVLTELGYDATPHRARRVTADLLARMDVVLTMTESHRRAILDRFPEFEDIVERLSPTDDVPDPIGLPIAAYFECARELERLIDDYLERP